MIVFLSSADDPIRQAELKLLKKVDPSDGKKIFFVVNKADNCDEDELTDAQTHDLETLENAGIKYENHLYSISAKQAMEGKTDQFDFDRLSADIGNFILNNKLEIQRNGFLNTVRNATSAVTSALQLMITNEKQSDEELKSSWPFSRPMSLKRKDTWHMTLENLQRSGNLSLMRLNANCHNWKTKSNNVLKHT